MCSSTQGSTTLASSLEKLQAILEVMRLKHVSTHFRSPMQQHSMFVYPHFSFFLQSDIICRILYGF